MTKLTTMKKTIREHLNDLPEPYRTEALENLDADWNDWKDEKDEYHRCKLALAMSFPWHLSPQKSEYWRKIYNEL